MKNPLTRGVFFHVEFFFFSDPPPFRISLTPLTPPQKKGLDEFLNEFREENDTFAYMTQKWMFVLNMTIKKKPLLKDFSSMELSPCNASSFDHREKWWRSKISKIFFWIFWSRNFWQITEISAIFPEILCFGSFRCSEGKMMNIEKMRNKILDILI